MGKHIEFWTDLKDDSRAECSIKYGVGLLVDGDLKEIEKMLEEQNTQSLAEARDFMHHLVDKMFAMATDHTEITEVTTRKIPDGKTEDTSHSG